MIGLVKPSRNPVRPTRTRSARPVVEGLEDRLLLYAPTGDVWPHPILVTYSFMPDGTENGSTPSSLFATLNPYYSTAAWQNIIAKAAASWQQEANVNFAQVSDDGTPEGSGLYEQGAPDFGDIRIGAMPLPPTILAETIMPPPSSTNSDAGDIYFNSTMNWSPSTGYDLMTVALHEFGHTMSLDDEASPTTAVMFGYYNGVKQVLTTDDINGIQSAYGARVTASNSSIATAAPITLNGSDQAVVTGLQLANNYSNDFSVVIPSGTSGTLTVTMQSSGLSLLEPRLTLSNSSPRALAQASSATYGGTVTVTLTGVTAGQLYYITASPDVSGAGSAGAYGLTVNAGTGTMPAIAPPFTSVLATTGGSNGAENMGDMKTTGSLNRPAVLTPVEVGAETTVPTIHKRSDVNVHAVVVGRPHPLALGRARGQGTTGSSTAGTRHSFF